MSQGTIIIIDTGALTIEAIENALANRTYDGEVSTFATLPDPTTVNGQEYFVETPTGTKWLGTYRDSGFYRSNGTSWVYVNNTSKEIQDQINLGIESARARRGFIFVGDNQYTTGSRLTIPTNTRTKITNNAAVNLNTNKPTGIDMWNPTTNNLQGITQNDTYGIRFRCTADPTQNNRNFTIEVEINAPTNAVIWSKTVRLARGAGVDTNITEQIELFSGINYQANGASIYVTCDGEVSLYDFSFFIEKRYDGD